MPEARLAVLVAGLLGQAAAVLAGVLPTAVLPVTALLLVVASALAGRTPAHRVEQVRQLGTLLALVAVLLTLPQLAGGGAADLRATLGPLLVGVQCAQALTWTARRDLQVGLLVAVSLLVLGGSYAPDLVVGLPLLAGWVATVVAVVLLVRRREHEAADVVVADGAAPRGTVPLVAALALVAGLVAFLLVPVPQDSALQSRLSAAANGAAEDASGRARSLTSDVIDTSSRGDLRDTPVAEVPGDSPRLWRHRSFSTWDGRTWSSPGAGLGRVPGTSPYALADAPAGRTDEVLLLARGGTVWTPGQAVAVDVDSRLVGDGDGALTARPGTTSYTVTTAAQDLTGLGSDTAGSADPRWLQLPSSTTERTRALAREITAGTTSQAQAVVAIEAWLEDNLQYDLDSPVPGRDEDAVDRFLFVDRVGFCEQFAAAEVVLLRSLGIPSRFVTGLAYGVDAGGGARTFREKDLHAWVEVSYAGAGWVASDPTSGAAQAASAEQGPRERLAAWLRAALAKAGDVPGGHLTVAAALVGLVVVAALLRRRVVRRPEPLVSAEAPLPADGDASALAAFLRLDRRLASRRRAPAESLSEMAARLGLGGEQARAFATVEDECYAPDRPDPRSAVEVLDRWEPSAH